METRKSRLHSPSSSLSRSRSPISDNDKRSISTSPRRGPSTPNPSSNKRTNTDDEQDRDLLTLVDENKTTVDETSSTAMSDEEQKKRSHHRHHHHRHHHKQAKVKSNKRSATHQRHSVKRSKKETVPTRHQKSDDEHSRTSSEKKSSESEASKSEEEISSSNNESDDEEGVIKGNTTPKERQNRRHRKKHRSSPSVNEKTSLSPPSSPPTSLKSTKGTQLIVNYLPSSLRESDFYQLFARIAPIKLCKLITDRHTGHSFCYGFIEYHNKDDAIKAIEKFNGYKIEQKKLKVSYAQPKSSSNQTNDDIVHEKPSVNPPKNPNIYITDLPESFDEKMLERLFSKYGEIVKTKVLRDPRTRISRGVAFVLMTSARYAERAIKALDGHIPSGCRAPISVKYADPSKTTSTNNGNNTPSSRFANAGPVPPAIGPYGYPPAVPSYNMMDPYYAAAYHHHHHHRASMNMRDMSPSPPPPMPAYYPSGSSRSYSNHSAGSSTSRTRTMSPGLPRSYSNSSSKQSSNLTTSQPGNGLSSSALSAACELIAKGCQQAIDPNGFVIYAFGLPNDCDENDLEELFGRYGDVYRVYIVRNYATGESKGYSFVTMRNYDEACQAVTRLDGSAFQGRTIQVRFKQ